MLHRLEERSMLGVIICWKAKQLWAKGITEHIHTASCTQSCQTSFEIAHGRPASPHPSTSRSDRSLACKWKIPTCSCPGVMKPNLVWFLQKAAGVSGHRASVFSCLLDISFLAQDVRSVGMLPVAAVATGASFNCINTRTLGPDMSGLFFGFGGPLPASRPHDIYNDLVRSMPLGRRLVRENESGACRQDLLHNVLCNAFDSLRWPTRHVQHGCGKGSRRC